VLLFGESDLTAGSFGVCLPFHPRIFTQSQP
jgi:hypothetical protein